MQWMGYLVCKECAELFGTREALETVVPQRPRPAFCMMQKAKPHPVGDLEQCQTCHRWLCIWCRRDDAMPGYHQCRQCPALRFVQNGCCGKSLIQPSRRLSERELSEMKALATRVSTGARLQPTSKSGLQREMTLSQRMVAAMRLRLVAAAARPPAPQPCPAPPCQGSRRCLAK